MGPAANKKEGFSKYQVFIITILALLQFTIILDFMVLSPLGERLLDQLHISTSQFGFAVSAYAFSAGASGLLAAGFADKFDRKKLLLFFYVGFVVGTMLCAMAPTYLFLLTARIVTGIFGGVLGSVSFAIISDLFKYNQRGRVMGFVQSAFAASQVLGLPIGLLLANLFDWHAPFWMISGLGVILGVIIVVYMKPINKHLEIKSDRNPFGHMLKIVSNANYLKAFLATIFMSTAGFMMMPFGTAYNVHNMGLTRAQLPTLYIVTGFFTILFGPLTGKLSDKIGSYKVFFIGSIISMIMVGVYSKLGLTPLGMVIVINIILFVGIMSRMISGSALMTAIPEPEDRGAFMSVQASIHQFSGAVAAAVGGLIVVQQADGRLEHYDRLCYVVLGTMVLAIGLVYVLHKYVQQKVAKSSNEQEVLEEVMAEAV
jgi:predicted MFS family arabinose efflux permease